MAATPRKKAVKARAGQPVPARDGTRAPLDGRRSRDQEVLETAMRLFSEKGYASTSVQDVADALGMLKGSLYYYIDTKETLLRRIIENSHVEVSEIAERHRASRVLPMARLAAFLEEYALWYIAHPERASLFAREWRHASNDLREVMTEQRRYYDDVLRELIVAAQEAGEIGQEIDLRLATYYIMSAVSSLPDWFDPRGRQSGTSVAKSYAHMTTTLLTNL